MVMEAAKYLTLLLVAFRTLDKTWRIPINFSRTNYIPALEPVLIQNRTHGKNYCYILPNGTSDIAYAFSPHLLFLKGTLMLLQTVFISQGLRVLSTRILRVGHGSLGRIDVRTCFWVKENRGLTRYRICLMIYAFGKIVRPFHGQFGHSILWRALIAGMFLRNASSQACSALS